MDRPSSPAQAAPARRLPLLYFALAYLSLAWAFASLAVDPRGVAGFFYHPRMLAVVHLVTLGWISCSILGALYIVAPMALRLPLAARKLDYVAFGLVAVGVSGMVSHFWLDEASGMAMAAGLVTLGFLYVALRMGRALSASPIPREVKLHFRLAFLNLVLAAGMGLLLGVNKVFPFLPGYVLTNVYAHAHLAALGWATMMVMAAGYRLLPMLLPSAMPTGPGVYASAILLEAGALGLFAGLILESAWVRLFAWLVAAGIAAFFLQVRWMLTHRRTAPRTAVRPDFGVWHALQGLAYLALSTSLGLLLVNLPPAAWKLQAAMAYGVTSLVGFLAQMVAGISSRLLPPFFWLWGLAAGPPGPAPDASRAVPARRLQAIVFVLWTACVPALAVALTADALTLLRWAATGLFVAVVVAAVANVAALRRALTRPAG